MSHNKLSGKVIDELLQKFVSTDEFRPKLMKPWREREYIYASESHILIRVSGHLTATQYPQYNYDDTNKLFPKGCPIGIITLEQLTKVLNDAPLVDEMKRVGEDVECEECNGTGEVEWDYKRWSKNFDCPLCDGAGYISRSNCEQTGKKIVDPEAAVNIGQYTFRAYLLNILLKAMKTCRCDYVSVILGIYNKATCFNLTEDIDIIVMPVIQNNAYTTIKIEDLIQ